MKPSSNKSLLAQFYRNTIGNENTNGDGNGDETSSDEDYTCTDESESDDDSAATSSSSSSSSQVNSAQATGSEEDDIALLDATDEHEEKETQAATSGKSKTNGKSATTTSTSSREKKATTTSTSTSTNVSSLMLERKHHEICCVCLSDQSNSEQDELVSCDSCGLFTHEGCYGISDSASKQSTSSSASTEPWFCDSCLFDDDDDGQSPNGGPRQRACELCPNTECGLMKQTDNGRFVHILCAVYTPGVTYQDTDKLWPAVLDEIAYGKWGEQACSLCEQAQFARTGVCIQCDAGLCKSYFHATCAQRHGLLVDPLQMNANEPFIAYCKQHNERGMIASRRTNYLAMMANYKSTLSRTATRRLFEHSDDRQRLAAKFDEARRTYALARLKLTGKARQQQQQPAAAAGSKVPRMLTTCPSALAMLLNKAQFSSCNGNAPATTCATHARSSDFTAAPAGSGGDHETSRSSSSVAFTANFVKYYYEREMKMTQYYKDVLALRHAQDQLGNQEIELRINYETKSERGKRLREEHERITKTFETCTKLVATLAPTVTLPNKITALLLSSPPQSRQTQQLPQQVQNTPSSSATSPKKTDRSLSATNATSPILITITKTATVSIERLDSAKMASPKKVVHKSSDAATTTATTTATLTNHKPKQPMHKPLSTEKQANLNAECCKCGKKTNAHLLVECDTCHKYYHTTCLDPPLSSVPKKTKLYGWECSYCVAEKEKTSSEDEVEEVDTTSGDTRKRRGRKSIKLNSMSPPVVVSPRATRATTPSKRGRKPSNKTTTPTSPATRITKRQASASSSKSSPTASQKRKLLQQNKVGENGNGNGNGSKEEAIFIDGDSIPNEVNEREVMQS